MFICDACTYPSRATDYCDNPACFANPTLSEAHKATMRARAEEAAQRRAEDEQRRAFKARLHAAGFTTF